MRLRYRDEDEQFRRELQEWLAANATDPEADEIRARHERWKRSYLRHGRDYCGWAIFVGVR